MITPDPSNPLRDLTNDPLGDRPDFEVDPHDPLKDLANDRDGDHDGS